MTGFQTICPALGAALVAIGIYVVTLAAWVGIATIAFALLFMAMFFVDGRARDRRSLLGWIRRRDNAFVYDRAVAAIDATVTRMLSPDTAEEKPKPAGRVARLDWYTEPKARDAADRARLAASAFSWPVMDAALKIALVYPLVFLLIQWAVTNQPTGVLDFRPLQPAPWYGRVAATCPVVALVVANMLASATSKGVFETLSTWLLWLTLAFAFAFAGAFAFTVAVAVAFAFAGAVAGAFTVAFADAGAVAVAVAVAVAGAFTVAFAVAGAVAVGRAVESGRAWLGYGGLMLGGALIVAAALARAAGGEADARLVVVFAIGLLPIVNAAFDYLSYGVTLTLLRVGRAQGRWPTWLCGALDAVAAVLILIGVALTLALIVAGINAAAAVPFLPLDRLLAALADPATRGDYVWLYASLLTTLVPTAVHLVVVLFSATTWVPMRLKRRFVDWIEDDTSDLLTAAGAAAFSAFMAAYGVGLAYVAYRLVPWLWRNFEAGAELLLFVVTWLLRAVGAV